MSAAANLRDRAMFAAEHVRAAEGALHARRERLQDALRNGDPEEVRIAKGILEIKKLQLEHQRAVAALYERIVNGEDITEPNEDPMNAKVWR